MTSKFVLFDPSPIRFADGIDFMRLCKTVTLDGYLGRGRQKKTCIINSQQPTTYLTGRGSPHGYINKMASQRLLLVSGVSYLDLSISFAVRDAAPSTKGLNAAPSTT
ncbi:hypothetical protein DPMN_099097 [Dreissena polymorpha]|uniref:Uncharacterized protein n=1 Tax=Dreissena polymorpha TaxID=45954 RepID=A0A9D4LDB0_DREPO|nr:hypothetical protein DPMN_099097 [Dreissena polymorpha]